MAEFSSEVAEQLAQLRKTYMEQLPGKVAELQSAYDAARDDAGNVEMLRTFHRMAHSLAGSSAIYGVADLSAKAKEIEYAIEPAVKHKSPISVEQNDLVVSLLRELASLSKSGGGR